MLVLIRADEAEELSPLPDLPLIWVRSTPPDTLREGDVYLPAEGQGRGERLKQAFSYAFDRLNADGVITLPHGGCTEESIRAVQQALEGGAELADGGVLSKSPFRFGGLFRILTAFTTGRRRAPWCGLRGYSRSVAPLLASVSYRGGEYETVVLQAAVSEGIQITDLPMKENAELTKTSPAAFRSSFFGAWGIFMNCSSLKFLFSSGVAFVIDTLLLVLLAPLFPWKNTAVNEAVAQSIAWIVSSLSNFTINRKFVFRAKGGLWLALGQYYSLAAFVLLGKQVLLFLFSTVLSLHLLVAKLVCEVSFFVLNYFVQKKLIFRKKNKQ